MKDGKTPKEVDEDAKKIFMKGESFSANCIRWPDFSNILLGSEILLDLHGEGECVENYKVTNWNFHSIIDQYHLDILMCYKISILYTRD